MYYDILTKKVERNKPDLESLFKINGKAITITFCNPLTFKFLKQDEAYCNCLSTMDYIFSDGMLLCRFIKNITNEKCIRLSFDGNSVASDFFSLCRKYNKRVALVGATQGNIDIAVQKLSGALNIVYYRNGYFKNEEAINNFYKQLILNKAEVVIFGLGAPLQDKMLYNLKKKNVTGLFITCGGYIEQIAQKGTRYYPELINKFHLRWLYRIVNEPRKLIFRYVVDYSYFYMAFFKNIFKIKKPGALKYSSPYLNENKKEIESQPCD